MEVRDKARYVAKRKTGVWNHTDHLWAEVEKGSIIRGIVACPELPPGRIRINDVVRSTWTERTNVVLTLGNGYGVLCKSGIVRIELSEAVNLMNLTICYNAPKGASEQDVAAVLQNHESQAQSLDCETQTQSIGYVACHQTKAVTSQRLSFSIMKGAVLNSISTTTSGASGRVFVNGAFLASITGQFVITNLNNYEVQQDGEVVLDLVDYAPGTFTLYYDAPEGAKIKSDAAPPLVTTISKRLEEARTEYAKVVADLRTARKAARLSLWILKRYLEGNMPPPTHPDFIKTTKLLEEVISTDGKYKDTL